MSRIIKLCKWNIFSYTKKFKLKFEIYCCFFSIIIMHTLLDLFLFEFLLLNWPYIYNMVIHYVFDFPKKNDLFINTLLIFRNSVWYTSQWNVIHLNHIYWKYMYLSSILKRLKVLMQTYNLERLKFYYYIQKIKIKIQNIMYFL